MHLNPSSLLKLDIVGAFLTCTVTGAVLATEIILTGMPLWVLWTMSLAAGVFCLIGIAGYVRCRPVSYTLRTLSILNLCFCAGSGIAWFLNYQQLTTIGRLYFPIEIVIVFALAIVELFVSKSDQETSKD
jgi:hypothetical protein